MTLTKQDGSRPRRATDNPAPFIADGVAPKNMLSRDATTMAALGVSVAAFAVQLASRRKLARGSTQG